EFHAFALDVERATGGQVRIKWYFGGVAGNETEVGERIRKGQLDGAVSGSPLCEDAMRSMRIIALPGIFQNRGEVNYVTHLLFPKLLEEAQRSGYALLVTSGLGPVVFFSREPIHDLAELRRAPFWIWDAREAAVVSARAMGLNVVPLPI